MNQYKYEVIIYWSDEDTCYFTEEPAPGSKLMFA